MFFQTKLFALLTKFGPCIWGHNFGVTMLFYANFGYTPVAEIASQI
jgi:type 1 glutamine amidotransferase